MPATIKIKNSSTASAVPTSSDLVQGELAVNVTDRRLFTENASGTVVELGTNPTILTMGAAGSASAPVITRTGDTNTGIFFPAADTIAFAEGGVEAMRLDASGNLGIGATSMPAKLTVQAGGRYNLEIQPDASLPYIQAYDRTGSAFTDFAILANNIRLYTGGSERARIDSSGNLIVGNTTVPGGGAAATGAALGQSGYISVQRTAATPCFFGRSNDGEVMALYSGTTQRGQVSISGATTTYGSFSDYRLKENIVPLTGAVAKVMALKPSTFNFIEFPAQTINGFIAHEVAEVEPIAVTGQKDAVDEEGNQLYQSVDPAKLVPILTAAFQEQQTLIQDQLAIITSLTARIEALEQA
jgi:hypothetical protein